MSDINSLISWLNANGVLEIPDGVDIDYLADKIGAVGLYKIPEITEEPYIDGSALITEYYILLAKQTSGLKKARAKTVDTLEAFEDWIEAKTQAEDFPVYAKGPIQDISISSPVHLEESERTANIYQCTLAITYLKKRRK